MAKVMQVAVLGLGRFGAAVATELTLQGHDVLAVDRDAHVVQDIADHVTHSVQADITDEQALRDLGLEHFDAAIISVSGHLEASILATVSAKRLEIPRIVAKASSAIHGTILGQVGATRVVYPERETGIRLAHSFAASGVSDYLDVAPGYGLAKVQVPTAWVGKRLSDIDLHASFGVTALALHRVGSVTLNPNASERLLAKDELIVGGLDEDLTRIPGSE